MNKESFLPSFFPQAPEFDNSILNVIGPEMAQMRSGNPLMDEIQIYGGLYQQKMIEKVDRNEVMNMGRRAAKLFIISAVVGGSFNRLLTKTKIGKFDFLNIRIIPRVLIRLSIFALSFHLIFYGPLMQHIFKFRDNLNKKYAPRMKQYQLEMNPLIMNPSMLNEPGMSDEEREYMRVFYDNMMSQAAMMKAQMRMEKENRK